MAATQLSFTLRTSANVKTVHLIGSWDGYQGQLPLSRDGSKSGSWKGTFRFQSSVLKQGQRYWYYYMMDGYHVSHDPAQQFTTEPTTGRKLNILDVPASKSSSSSHSSSQTSSSKRASRRYSRDIPRGRCVSPTMIQSPIPQRPGQTKAIRDAQFAQATLEQLTDRLASTHVYDDDSSDSEDDSDDDSDCPSLSEGSSISSCSSPSSLSSASSNCTCERYGITRAGNRVKLDCGGSRCGTSDEEYCSSESEEEVYRERKHVRSTRRHAVLIRG